jgi:hypothetical protein
MALREQQRAQIRNYWAKVEEPFLKERESRGGVEAERTAEKEAAIAAAAEGSPAAPAAQDTADQTAPSESASGKE